PPLCFIEPPHDGHVASVTAPDPRTPGAARRRDHQRAAFGECGSWSGVANPFGWDELRESARLRTSRTDLSLRRHVATRWRYAAWYPRHRVRRRWNVRRWQRSPDSARVH